jgi:hypothetical protein
MIFITVGAGFGYWMDGVEARQRETVQRMRDRLVANREERAQREALEHAVSQKIYNELEKRTQQAAKES